VSSSAVNVLIVEDESAIAELLAVNLRHAGFTPMLAASAEDAERLITAVLPDLVVLDWMLPGASGLSFARSLRALPRTKELPIIMLTARAAEEDTVLGLEAGADDYLTKPFSPKELIARIRALLRRRTPHVAQSAVNLGALQVDPSTRKATVRADNDGAGSRPIELKLGPTEFKLLMYLAAHPERVHTRSQLLDKVWGDHVFIEERTVDVHVKRLREALDPAGIDNWLETVRGAGYRFAPQPVRSDAAARA
jgi:two-component system, OmpR family, phosphate regulon response regulator PhoB